MLVLCLLLGDNLFMNDKKKFDPHALHEKLMGYTNAAGTPLYHPRQDEEVKVQILPDKSVAAAKFLPHDLIPGAFKAHPTTIAAMRKDLFVGGDGEFRDLGSLVICEGCHRELDRQFWIFCPYCEARFPVTD